MENKPAKDALDTALDAVSDRWSLHIVRAVAFGARRYTDILGSVGAPRDVLSARLKRLSETGILEPAAPDRGRMSGYKLTAKGHDLGAVILVLKRWGETHREGSVPTRDFVHTHCGEVFWAQVVCAACGEAFSSADDEPLALVPTEGTESR